MNAEMDKGGVEGMPWASAHLTCCLKFLFRCNRVKGEEDTSSGGDLCLLS